MNPVLIYIMPSCPNLSLHNLTSFWCSPVGGADCAKEFVIKLPTEGIVPLCQALLAVEGLPVVNARTPLIITTTSELPLELTRGQPLPTSVRAWLSSPDNGVLYFPAADHFHRCSRQAIRRWNPLLGSVTLEAAWQQSKLALYE